jgi:hypothetical protein
MYDVDQYSKQWGGKATDDVLRMHTKRAPRRSFHSMALDDFDMRRRLGADSSP